MAGKLPEHVLNKLVAICADSADNSPLNVDFSYSIFYFLLSYKLSDLFLESRKDIFVIWEGITHFCRKSFIIKTRVLSL